MLTQKFLFCTTLLLYLVIPHHDHYPNFAYALETFDYDDGDLDKFSTKLQIDFMSNLYAEMTASSVAPASSSNQTVVTIKPSTTGAAFCSPSEDIFVEAVLLDFNGLVFKKRNFQSINKIAVYVVDKTLISSSSNESNSFVVSVNGASKTMKGNNFRMSASMAVGGKSVFLLPNETASVCVYFPMRQRANLGVFGAVWGRENAQSQAEDIEQVEESVLGSVLLTRKRRSVAFVTSNSTFGAGSKKKIEHPRFLLKERKSSTKRPAGKVSHKKGAKKLKAKSRSGKTTKKVWLPFGVEPTTSSTAKKGPKPRRALKNDRKRKRRQNHQKIVDAQAEVGIFGVTASVLNPSLSDNLLVDDPSLKDESCSHYKLPVRLAELGWKRVIIAPEEVDISYCAGVCSASKTPSKMANQAMLLQLFKVIRGASLPVSLPDAHCVPSSYSSLTLLFYDENENVVLKNYPNMIATTCGCR